MPVPTAPWKGIVYRAHNPLWAHAPTSGKGASVHGGRFNRKGLEALYTSLDLNTAWMEAQQGFAFKAQPTTMVAFKVDCDDIADLTDPGVQSAVGVNISVLSCAWENAVALGADPPTWTMADRLISKGVAGIIVPSFAPGCGPSDLNLVLWSWSEVKPHQVTVIDDFGRLPKN